MFYASLDPGIRFAVRVLHAHGIDTHQSCQGGLGHAYDGPTVDLGGEIHNAEGFAALSALAAFGLPVSSVSYHWSIDKGLPYENFWRVTFMKPMEERADERPNFVHGYQAQ